MGEPADDLMDSLVQTSFAVVALLSQAAAAHDLSLTQLRVLAILRDRTPRLGDLATYLGQERSSVSGLVDRAVRRGLVHREPSAEDARAVTLSLTADGRRLARQVTAEVRALLAPLTAPLGAADQHRLAALLTRLLP